VSEPPRPPGSASVVHLEIAGLSIRLKILRQS